MENVLQAAMHTERSRLTDRSARCTARSGGGGADRREQVPAVRCLVGCLVAPRRGVHFPWQRSVLMRMHVCVCWRKKGMGGGDARLTWEAIHRASDACRKDTTAASSHPLSAAAPTTVRKPKRKAAAVAPQCGRLPTDIRACARDPPRGSARSDAVRGDLGRRTAHTSVLRQ